MPRWGNPNCGFQKGNKSSKGNPPNKTSFKKGERASPETEFKKGNITEGNEAGRFKCGEKHHCWKGGLTRLQKLEQLAGRKLPTHCELCGKESKLCFDHDHKSGKFRGWICRKCNTALGMTEDNVQTLALMIKYVKNCQMVGGT